MSDGCFRCNYQGCDDCGYPEMDYIECLRPVKHEALTRKQAWKPYKKKKLKGVEQ